jgi:hypothetical protein
MNGQRRVGYARCSASEQDVIVQTEQLRARGAEPDWIYIDRGFSRATWSNRAGQSCRHPPFRCRWMP